MIYTSIYKIKLHKSIKRLYNLWWKPLIALQEKYIKTIEKMLGRWYQEALQRLRDDPEIKINDLTIDQTTFITKDISNTDLEEYSNMMTSGFNTGAKQLNASFKKDIKIEATFWLDPSDASKYANELAGARVTWVSDYSRKRINELVSQGVEKGWGYNKLASELKRDLAFSPYRARLIASQEIGEAYLRGKENQFEKYRKRYNQKGYKKWISHKDDRTTEGCWSNDNAWRLEFDKEFPSWSMAPTRFVWCRCNIVYRLFDPTDETLTIENATPSDEIQSYLPEDRAEGAKPIGYDEYNGNVLTPSYFNVIGQTATYRRTKWKSWFYRRYDDVIELWDMTWWYEDKVLELHESGHFFMERAVLQNEERLTKLKTIFTWSVREVKDLIKNKELRSVFNRKNSWRTVWDRLFEKYKDLWSIKQYAVTKEIKTVGTREIEKVVLSTELKEDIWSFMDTLGALTREVTVWNGHGTSYYKNSPTIFMNWKAKITERQLHEYFAHLNEVHWLWNPIIEKFLPETYKTMKSYYESIGLEFI